MEIKAKAKFVRISPKKVKPLLRDIKGKKTTIVLEALKYSPRKSGQLLYKLIASAVANANNNYNLDKENLKIKNIVADSGPTFKRQWMRSHGSADVRLKRTAHLSVVLEEVLPTSKKKIDSDHTKIKKSDSKGVQTKEKSSDTVTKSSETDKSSTPDVLDTKPDELKAKSSNKKLDIKKIFRRTSNK